jgi:hypothetical protein
MLLESRLVNWIVTCFRRGLSNILEGATLSTNFEDIFSRSNGNLEDQSKVLEPSITINYSSSSSSSSSIGTTAHCGLWPVKQTPSFSFVQIS